MALLAEHLKAIARVQVDGRKGTGFLVSDQGHVLTAAHVLADLEALRSRRTRADSIAATLTFQGMQPVQASLMTEMFSVDDDWALLKIREPLPALPACLRLAVFDPDARAKEWDAYGFPDHRPRGFALSGAVSVWGDPLQLVAPISKGLLMEGMSGAPVVVHGEVVALVKECPLDPAGQSVDGSLRAVTIGSMVAAARGILAVRNAEPVPLLDRVARAIENAGRMNGKDVRDTLRLSQLEPALDADRLALAMLQRGLETTTELLTILNVRGVNALTVLDCVGAYGVHPDAAARLHRYCQTRTRMAAIVRAQGDSTPWYVWRATGGRFPTGGVFARDVLEGRTFSVILENELTDLEALDCIKRQASEQARSPAAKKLVEALLAPPGVWRPRDWFLLVLDATPSPTVLRAIHGQLPGAHVIVRTAEPLALLAPELATDLELVEPEIEESIEQQMVDEYCRACRELGA